MEVLTIILVPGLMGGVAIALVILMKGWRVRRSPEVAGRPPVDAPMTDMINMSSIKVAGVGGLGLVAMATAVALNVPRIGASVGVGLALGALLAGILIVRARRSGPLPSSGRGTGASTVLSLQDAAPPAADASRDRRRTPPRDLSLVPVE